jgi:hypothetical protein
MWGRSEIIGDEGAERIGVIAAVGDDVADAFRACQQRFGLGTIAPLSGCRMDADRQAKGGNCSMEFGGQAATGPADRGSFSPPFAPAASA